MGQRLCAIFTFILLSSTGALAQSKVGVQVEAGASISNEETAPIMRTVLDAIKVLLPTSLNTTQFQSEENRELIREKLKILAAGSSSMREHFSGRAADYAFVAAAMEEDSRDALAFFDKGNYRQARFILHHLSTSCFSCHTKMPANKSFPDPKELFNDLAKYDIDRISLAQIKAMTRQFEEAMSLYEAEFKERPELAKTGLFSEYLKLCLRVDLNVERVDLLLAELLTSEGIPRSRVKPLDDYRRTAKVLKDKGLLTKVNKETVQQLIALGEQEQGQGFNGEGLIFFAGASSVAHRLLNDTELKPEQRSELYYLAGKAEAHISDSFWFSEFENYLELAIRLAPQATWAAKAYQLLDEEITVGFTGSSGTHVPEDLKAKMNELNALIVKAKPIQ